MKPERQQFYSPEVLTAAERRRQSVHDDHKISLSKDLGNSGACHPLSVATSLAILILLRWRVHREIAEEQRLLLSMRHPTTKSKHTSQSLYMMKEQ